MSTLPQMPNIAEKLTQQLQAAGITTPQQLRDIGSRKAWLRILANDPTACANRLLALEGAIQNIRWHHLPDDTKAELKAFARQYKGG